MNHTAPTCEVTTTKARSRINFYCEIPVTDWFSCCKCTLLFCKTTNRKCRKQHKLSQQAIAHWLTPCHCIYSSCSGFEGMFYNRHHNMDVTEPVYLLSNVLRVNTLGSKWEKCQCFSQRRGVKTTNAAFQRAVESKIWMRWLMSTSTQAFVAKHSSVCVWAYAHCCGTLCFMTIPTLHN